VSAAKPIAPVRARVLLQLVGLVTLLHCGKAASPASPPASGSASGPGAGGASGVLAGEAGAASLGDDDAGPMDAREAEAWARAQDAGEDDDVRLADLIGCEGLRERAGDPRLRPTALRAMAQCPDFSELPWLAEVGTTGGDAEALVALDAIVDQATRVRRATDPEDADELHVGCGQLLALADTKDKPAARRVRAIRALRMLADRGCVKRADIPTDLDAK
jgi:hypothetical protein